ncbi:hypothetical protein CON72_09200, partial [Bacillus wiedmannii]
PTGPTGSAGNIEPTGPTGSTGPTGLATSSFAELALISTQIVNQNEFVNFDSTFPISEFCGTAIELVNLDTLRIKEVGLYFVDFYLNLMPGSPSSVVFQLNENGGGVSETLNSGAVNGGMMAGSALINVITVPFNLSLQNVTGSPVTLEANTGLNGTVKGAAAFMRAFKFANGPST